MRELTWKTYRYSTLFEMCQRDTSKRGCATQSTRVDMRVDKMECKHSPGNAFGGGEAAEEKHFGVLVPNRTPVGRPYPPDLKAKLMRKIHAIMRVA